MSDLSIFSNISLIGAGTQTHLKITNNNNDINHLNESFIIAKVKLTGHSSKTYSASATDTSSTAPKTNCLIFFIGFKNFLNLIDGTKFLF